jgi:hypothetical protein
MAAQMGGELELSFRSYAFKRLNIPKLISFGS